MPETDASPASDVKVVNTPQNAPHSPTPVQAMSSADMAKLAQMEVRYNSGPKEQELSQWRTTNSWQHSRPNSIYVAAMGHHWKPRSWARVIDMVHYCNQQGFYSNLSEVQDRCYQPYDALGTMRNEAILRARQGWEWLCYVDNDVLPAEDTLYRLVSRANNEGRSIIAPYIEEPGTGKKLHGPDRQKFTGIQTVRWCVLSMLIFRTSVFNGTGANFWSDAIGADEGVHFQKLYDIGHIPVLDTEIVVPVAQTPTYPLTTLRMPKQDAEAFWEQRKASFLTVPDRRPIMQGDPRVKDGVYMPFIKPPCPNDKTHGDMIEKRHPDGVEYICEKCVVVPKPQTVTVQGEGQELVTAAR